MMTTWHCGVPVFGEYLCSFSCFLIFSVYILSAPHSLSTYTNTNDVHTRRALSWYILIFRRYAASGIGGAQYIGSFFDPDCCRQFIFCEIPVVEYGDRFLILCLWLLAENVIVGVTYFSITICEHLLNWRGLRI